MRRSRVLWAHAPAHGAHRRADVPGPGPGTFAVPQAMSIVHHCPCTSHALLGCNTTAYRACSVTHVTRPVIYASTHLLSLSTPPPLHAVPHACRAVHTRRTSRGCFCSLTNAPTHPRALRPALGGQPAHPPHLHQHLPPRAAGTVLQGGAGRKHHVRKVQTALDCHI